MRKMSRKEFLKRVGIEINIAGMDYLAFINALVDLDFYKSKEDFEQKVVYPIIILSEKKQRRENVRVKQRKAKQAKRSGGRARSRKSSD